MKQRMPRKLKKRIKKHVDTAMSLLNDPAVKQAMDDMSRALMTFGRWTSPIIRIPPMTDEQKKAWMEERDGTFEVITFDEAAERWGLTEADRINLRRYK